MRPGSWGIPASRPAAVRRLAWRSDPLPAAQPPLLAYGRGRSYGDVCLNDGGVLLDTRGLDRFIAFDRASGRLRCEAGATLARILSLALPAGWFLPVTPGTRWVSLGGAIANDVHGKNHHRAGSFGRHVLALELARSDGSRLRCSAAENPELFRATIGGLGLTGLITWAEIQLRRVPGPMIRVQAGSFDGLDHALALFDAADREDEYTVAWMDAACPGRMGRGVLFRGNHAEPGPGAQAPVADPDRPPRLTVPPWVPPALINPWSSRLFARLYARRHAGRLSRLESYASFFYPLDGIGRWNRLYGPRGLIQYQFVVPRAAAPAMLREVFEELRRRGLASALAVLKVFGDRPAAGLLSFARPGVTLAMDFPNCGRNLYECLERLDARVAEAGGAVYPAKDARMSGESFRRFFPELEAFRSWVDPGFSSGFWRRVAGVGS